MYFYVFGVTEQSNVFFMYLVKLNNQKYFYVFGVNE